ncbi:MAG: CinA family nicotinamide mononucleotide deamidase-related protein [Parachlamydiaceae bacterium]
MSLNSVEIVAIGSEILVGQAVNSNAAFLSRRLVALGFTVQRHTVLPDDLSALREGLAESLCCNQLVIATGGLGPTCDDLTKQVAAELFDSSFILNKELLDDLTVRFGEQASFEGQATVPIKARLLKNQYGTAPGFVFTGSRGTLVLLPGEPHEMKEMFEAEVAPLLQKYFFFDERIFIEEIHFGNLFESQVDPELRKFKENYPELSTGIYPRNGLLTVQVKASDPNLTGLVSENLKAQFVDHLFDSENGKIEEALHAQLKSKHLTLSVAESCTGGKLASRLTALKGASEFFVGGVVSYSNQMKEKVLNVPYSLIKEKGAVSKDVAMAMAEGVQALCSSDISLSITGIAGPSGGTKEKPVGTVFLGIKIKNQPVNVHLVQANGSRTMIIEQATNIALSKLYFLVKAL